MNRIDFLPWLTSTDHYIIGWWGLNLIFFSHVVLLQPPLWVTYFYNIILYGIGVGLGYVNNLIRRLIILGTVAGGVELIADYFLVEIANTLVYPSSLPMILRSPLYMPLAWAILITQMGYLAYRLNEHHGSIAGSVIPAILAIGIVGIYEMGARTAGIWMYTDAPLFMIGHAPLFILIAEGCIFAVLQHFVRQLNPFLSGLAFGLVIVISYIGIYTLFSFVGTLGYYLIIGA
ncbi:MAG: hypothetical protein ABEI06_08210 [Halobacteriaceae archaeon]